MPACKLARGIASTRTKVPIKRVAALRFARRQRQAAVAGDHGGDAMFVGRRTQRVPPKLRVEVGVKIDDPGRHRKPADIEHALRGFIDSADGGMRPLLMATSPMNDGKPEPS